MNLPICGFDAKNSVLCPQCETKLEDGILTDADVDAAIKIAGLAKNNKEINRFTLLSCREIKGQMVITLSRKDIVTIRNSKTLYGLLQKEFKQKIWLVDEDHDSENFIRNLFFPIKIRSVNTVWEPHGAQKIRAMISGRYTPKFPIDINKVREIVKTAKNLDMDITFEDDKR